MTEWDIHGEAKKIIQVRPILSVLEEPDAVAIAGFHGTAMANALMYSRYPDMTILRGRVIETSKKCSPTTFCYR